MLLSEGGQHGETGICWGVPASGSGADRDRAKGRGGSADLGISVQTIYKWRRQDRIDKGHEPGLSSAEHGELVVAHKRIRELETELAVHRRATELLKEDTDPKAASRRSK